MLFSHVMWGNVKMIHRKLKHNQSQGLIEGANHDFEDILITRMAENNS